MIRPLLVTSVAAGLVAAVAVAPALALGGPRSAESASSGAVTKTKTVTRTHVSAGKDQVVDKRTVTLTVDTTTGLRGRQAINVSWSGAHPTGGAVVDQNAGSAATVQEYPMVLMQCRGIDSQSVPPAKRIRPESCWTQTPYERFSNDYNSSVPPWRLDRFATASERKQYVNAPKKRPPLCFGAAEAERWVPFVTAKGKSYPGGPQGCAGTPPEATDLGGSNLPSNTTYASTAPNGRGSAVFNVRTSETNASLGCSDKVPCSLVAIPIMGISCDADATGLPASDRPTGDDLTAARDRCEAKGKYAPGSNAIPGVQGDPAVTGAMWWSASNWRNRINVPLSFAPSGAACDITGASGVSLFGSELMIQATAQWSPTFCLDSSRTPVKHIQTGEPQARNLLKSGLIDGALVSQAPDGVGYTRPVVSAPVAMTGFAVTYAIDGENGRAYTKLRLTPRLLAKLLTSSYPAITAVKDGYKAISGNPLNITSDPEFLQLNPGVKHDIATQSAATILSLSSDSDVINALTSYIDADPEARAWLDGKPDPWGMVVNPNYKNIDLPVDTWRSLDTYEPTSIYKPGVNDCLAQNPVPYLPLVAAPMTRLSYIGLAMQFSLANSQVVCTLPSGQTGSTDGAKLVALGRQTPGFRFMIGINSLGDSDRYAINSAALQTHVDDSSQAVAGRTFVKPTNDSLRAAAGFLKPDPARDAWSIPYGELASNQKAAGAYPGAMLVYAAVPTKGLAKDEAGAYADWLRYVVTKGQRPGTQTGQLPDGYLPLTDGNGLAGLANYSLKAADAIEAQQGDVPKVDKKADPNDPNVDKPPTSGTPNAPGVPGGQPPTTDGPGGAGPKTDQPTLDAAPAGSTLSSPVGPAGIIVPLVVALAVAIGIVAGITLLRDRLRRSP